MSRRQSERWRAHAIANKKNNKVNIKRDIVLSTLSPDALRLDTTALCCSELGGSRIWMTVTILALDSTNVAASIDAPTQT